jgi:hypothetical protein
MELTRQRIRQQALSQFKHIRTCLLARQLCLLVRTNRVAFDPEDIKYCCNFIASLCKEAGCDEPSGLCEKAAEAVVKNEAGYLQFCEQSCMKCGESRRVEQPKRAEYIA